MNAALQTQKATMSSREIAKISGKPHADVLKAIRAMEPAWTKINEGNFSLVEYTDAKGEKRPEYQLDMFQCLYIATKFNDEARAMLVLRWEELETATRQNLLLPESISHYPENTVITVQMAQYSNQIYITEGVIFAKLAPIARYLGYDSTPTYYLDRLGKNNCRKIVVGKYDAWFINEIAFAELTKQRNNIPFSKIKTIYKDLFGIDKQTDNQNPHTYQYTDSQMLDIILLINKKPISKEAVIELLANGKIN